MPVGEWKKQRGNLEKYTKEGAQNNKIAKTNKQRTKLSKLGQERKDTENALLIKLQINILSLAPGFFLSLFLSESGTATNNSEVRRGKAKLNSTT